jgi:hypothetical protein
VDAASPTSREKLAILEREAVAKRVAADHGLTAVPAAERFTGRALIRETATGARVLVIVDEANRRVTALPADADSASLAGRLVTVRADPAGRLSPKPVDRSRGGDT